MKPIVFITYAGDDDVTPDVSFTYDRMGRQKTVTDCVGTRTFDYRTTDLQPLNEDIVAGMGGLYSRLITRRYEDGSGDTVAGRYAGFEMGDSSDTDADFTVTYGYDEDRRVLDQVKGTGLPGLGVNYVRPLDGSTPVSDMVGFYRYTDATQGTLVSVTREFEAQRDAVASITNEEALYYNTISKYTYGHDDLGRRTSVVYEGTAFDQDHLFNWGYNPRSELVLAEQHEGTDPDDPGTAYSPNGSFAYLYDDIGNP